MIQTFSLKNNLGFSYDVNFSLVNDSDSLILSLHGLNSSQNVLELDNFSKILNISCASMDYCSHGSNSTPLKHFSNSECLNEVNQTLNFLKQETNVKNLYIFGSSFGGYLSLAVSSIRDDINGLVLKSPVTRLNSLEDKFNEFNFGENILDESLNFPDGLIVHGDLDEIVPISDSDNFVKNNSNLTLVKLLGANHTFSNQRDKFLCEQKLINYIIDQKW